MSTATIDGTKFRTQSHRRFIFVVRSMPSGKFRTVRRSDSKTTILSVWRKTGRGFVLDQATGAVFDSTMDLEAVVAA